MIAGLPGTGIGGLYYALTTLKMPFRELSARKRRGWSRWGLIVGQMTLAVVVIATMWITGDIAGRIIALCVAHGKNSSISTIANLSTIASGKYNIMTVPFLFWTLGAIVILHLIIHGTRLAVRVSAIIDARRD